MIKIAEYAEKSTVLLEKTRKAFLDAKIEMKDIVIGDSKIRIVFAGQFSAGKSSIVKMLTGRDDIETGAEITTQKANMYEWNGIELVDTPGIHTQLRKDHDEISYKAISSADMIVFVITNELFDSHLAEHFRKLAIDRDKAGEMILVVNKMDRTTSGNTIEQQSIIKEALKGVLDPYTPEQLHICFMDAESYLESLEEQEDPEIAEELLERSGYDTFVSTFNAFIKEKNTSSKLTTLLYQLDDMLEEAAHSLEPKSVDSDIDMLEEHYLQQRRQYVEARKRLQIEIKNIFMDAASEIRNIGLDAANLIEEGCKKEEVEDQLEQYISRTEEIAEQCQQEARERFEERLSELDTQIEILENSVFAMELKNNLNMKYDKLPVEIQKHLLGAVKGANELGQKLVKNAYKAGAAGGMKLGNFAGGNVHKFVLNAGHFFKHKFKPWEAVKIAKGAAVGGMVLGGLGIGLNVFMQIKNDVDAEKIKKELSDCRQNIRSQFNTVANDLQTFGREFVNDNIDYSLSRIIAEVDEAINSIRQTRSEKREECKIVENLKYECRLLIQEIHNSL